jgi:hypothetical protein
LPRLADERYLTPAPRGGVTSAIPNDEIDLDEAWDAAQRFAA